MPSGSSATVNFAVANLAISTMGFAITAAGDPAHDLGAGRAWPQPDRAALLMARWRSRSLSRPDRGSAHRSGPPAAADGPSASPRHDHLARVDGPDHPDDRRPERWPHAAARHRQQLQGARTAPPRPAICHHHARAPVPGSTTPPARSAQCSARPPSPSSWTRLAAQAPGAVNSASGSGHQLPTAVAETRQHGHGGIAHLPPAVLVNRPAGRLFFERPGHLARR